MTILGADGVALTIAYTAPQRVTLCATDDAAARLEDLQDVLGQGPGPTAYATGKQMHTDIGTDERRGNDSWPDFDRAARKAFTGVTLVAVPIHPDGEVLGVLTYHHPTGSRVALSDNNAQFLADAVGVALLSDPDTIGTDLSGPWTGRAQIHQATGMVVTQLGLASEDAIALLRAHAFANDWTLAETAAAVLRRDLDFRHPETSDESATP